MTKRRQLITWLADAHAMEVGIVSTLEKHIADAKSQPRVRAALTKHLRETKKHATAVKQALAALGGSHPVVKEGVSKLVNLVAGVTTSLARDTSVKNAIADFATEHFEIACYTSLSLTAAELGETKIANTCKAILKEEQAMAKTLEKLFPSVNATYLASLDEEKLEEEEDGRRTSATTKRSAKVRSAPKRGAAKRRR